MQTVERTWSDEQIKIFDWFERPTAVRSLVVNAYAGTGKSTTIREAVRRAPDGKILIAAFSKAIEQDMIRLLGSVPNTEVKTLHGIGFAAVRRYRERLKVDSDGARASGLTAIVCDKTVPDAVLRSVTKLHTYGREMAPHAKTIGDLTEIAITFECQPDAQWASAGYDSAYVETRALAAMELAAAVQSGESIDFADMLFLPVRNRWMTATYDMVVIDEAQDMTMTQLELAQGALKPGGRIVVVGDRHQAIYGFRGADSQSLGRLRSELSADELGLSTTYRCARAVVKHAQRYVPLFTAHESCVEGIVRDLHMDRLTATVEPGDFILSRVNAPLVSIAMRLLRAGRRARVAGRDIGKNLSTLIRRMKARSVPDLLGKIESWSSRETDRLRTQLAAAKNGRKAVIESKMAAISDQADMLVSLTDGSRSVTEVELRIDSLFSDTKDSAVIVCSSVHKSKGLEADSVYVLADTFRGDSDEENNLRYVAATRARRMLTFVYDEE